ncbi:MAG TPA: MFS transporter [Gaiellales bacterium]|jgi:EmrB/QacA subfamily drug resistance transporter|nr:MFS transporter [Gaiellales bacterium]
MSPDNDRKWLALILLCAVQFMVVLDVAIVNVALPTIKNALGFSDANLQWVVSAYTLTFGGFLMLGSRIADLLGRKRLFIAGLVLFSAASLACGLSQSDTQLIVFRAIQGLGAAVISPAALAILTTTFAEGEERNKALAIWGAIAGTGGAVGVLLGGILTDQVGWEWIFFLNVPIGLIVILAGQRVLHESRVELGNRSLDIAGAILVTAGLTLLVYGLVTTDTYSWTSTRVLGALAGAAVLLAGFIAVELRAKAPILPFSIFRLRSLTGANIVGLLLGAAIFSMFFLLSLYMQQVLGYSALKAGVAYLLVASVIVVAAGASQALVTRIGVRSVLTTGMVLLVAGLVWFSQVSVHGAYATDLAPGFVLAGIGLGFSFVPVQIASLIGVTHDEAGIASGLINTSQQVGGALGVAVLSTITFTRYDSYLGDHGNNLALVPNALVDGFHIAFLVGAGMALIGLVATLLFIPKDVKSEQPVPAGEPAIDLG